jgi:hypothetical protein
MLSEEYQPDDHDDDGQQEHKDGYPIDTMHIPHPLRIRFFRVPFPDVEILGYLS